MLEPGRSLAIFAVLSAFHVPRKRELVEDSPQRAMVLEMIQQEPGIPLGELLKRLPLGWGTLYHHVRKLSQAGTIQICAAGRRRLLYPADYHVQTGAAMGGGLLRGKTARRVAEVVVARPGCNAIEISEEMGESHRVVYYHVKRLLSAGLIAATDVDGSRRLTPEPLLLRLLDAERLTLSSG